MDECYITIPESIYTKYKPNPTVLYGLFNSLSVKEGYCWISNTELAQRFNVDVSTIKRIIKILKKDKLIKTEGNTKRKIYITDRGKNEPYKQNKAQNCTITRGKNEPSLGAKMNHKNNKENNKEIINKRSYDLDELMKIK